jgi:flavin reductase (DIM6/NTAB) family NADH-FMN oxidoreductase RutF
MDEVVIQRALGQFDRTVWIVTSSEGDELGGLVATFVNSASLVPALPRLLVGIAVHHHTWRLMRTSRAFTAHLVDEAHCDLLWRFGLSTGHSTNKFAGVSWRRAVSGAPVLDDALAWLDCVVETTFEIGDRSLFLGAIVDGQVNGAGPAMTSTRLFELADEERRRRLLDDRRHDEALDAGAIQQWRAAQRRSSPAFGL